MKSKAARPRFPTTVPPRPEQAARVAGGSACGGDIDQGRCELLAHELHDSIAQQLGFLSFQASRIESLLQGKGEPALLISEMRGVLGRVQKQVRELITGARIGMQGRSLRETLVDAVQEFSHHSGIVFELDNRWKPDQLAPDRELQVLHIVREALANVVRHSHATLVRVALTQDAESGGALQVAVEDNGIGIRDERADDHLGHYGLSIMKERARAMGAMLTLESHRPQGLRITLHIPAIFPAEAPTGAPA